VQDEDSEKNEEVREEARCSDGNKRADGLNLYGARLTLVADLNVNRTTVVFTTWTASKHHANCRKPTGNFGLLFASLRSLVEKERERERGQGQGQGQGQRSSYLVSQTTAMVERNESSDVT
jgi:hypothetical protein